MDTKAKEGIQCLRCRFLHAWCFLCISTQNVYTQYVKVYISIALLPRNQKKTNLNSEFSLFLFVKTTEKHQMVHLVLLLVH